MEQRSQKQERESLSRLLRAQGKTWMEIAEVFRGRYRVNARIALRWARLWSQQRAADEWNKNWPDEPKTHKNFSYWELWPAHTGHAPSLCVLNRLAELYSCSTSFLLVDQADYCNDDEAHTALSLVSDPPATSPGTGAGSAQTEALFLDLLTQHPTIVGGSSPTGGQRQEVNFDAMAQVIMMWANQLNPGMSRRDLMIKLSTAFSLAAAAPMLDLVDPDERPHVARVLRDSGHVDEPTLRYFEGIVGSLRRQADVVGPSLTLQSVMGHRQVARRLAKAAQPAVRSRAVSVYAELTQLVGWLCFNTGDYRSAQHYYDQAREAAHEIENTELVIYVLCTMSQLATWQDKPRVGIDHAVAAGVWADQTGSPHAQAYAADVAVRAYVAARQPDKCHAALDREHAAVQALSSQRRVASWWYFYDESFYWRTRGECALRFHQPELAMTAVEKSLGLADPANVHNYSFRLLFRAEACIQQEAVTEASAIIGDVASLTSANSSHRIEQRIDNLRATLAPWRRAKAVRELDERLAAYRRVEGNGSGRTKRTYSR